VVAALLLAKALMWVVALGSGTSGGVLAPLLMLGAGLGTVLGLVLPGGDPAVWPLVFMAATLGGMMGAPIMSVVFAFELTNDTNALLPVLAMGRSILTEKIARRGHHIYREYGIDPLERHHVADVMTTQVLSIDAEATVARTLESHFGAQQAHRAFPVTRNGVVSACWTAPRWAPWPARRPIRRSVFYMACQVTSAGVTLLLQAPRRGGGFAR
jgi:hypothetical protein